MEINGRGKMVPRKRCQKPTNIPGRSRGDPTADPPRNQAEALEVPANSHPHRTLRRHFQRLDHPFQFPPSDFVLLLPPPVPWSSSSSFGSYCRIARFGMRISWPERRGGCGLHWTAGRARCDGEGIGWKGFGWRFCRESHHRCLRRRRRWLWSEPFEWTRVSFERSEQRRVGFLRADKERDMR